MYRERAFKRTIIFMRIRRYLFIFAFVILGLVGSFVLSEFLTDIVELEQKIGNMIMIGTAVTIFIIGFILTSALEFKIQQAYLEMKILKRLNVVSFKLSKLLESQGISLAEDFENTTDLVPTKKKPKIKKEKKIKNKNVPEKSFTEKLKVDLK